VTNTQRQRHNKHKMEAVVNEFPPPPSYYKIFQDPDQELSPPPIPSQIETYGGTLPIPSLELVDDDQQSHLIPRQLKQYEASLSLSLSVSYSSLLAQINIRIY
jgi:hypothetical protein